MALYSAENRREAEGRRTAEHFRKLQTAGGGNLFILQAHTKAHADQATGKHYARVTLLLKI